MILNFIFLSIMHLFSRVVVGADPYEVSGKFLLAGRQKYCGINTAVSTLWCHCVACHPKAK